MQANYRGVEKNDSPNRNKKVKFMSNDWVLNPYLALQNPVVLHTVLWNFLVNLSKDMKMNDIAEIRIRT